MKSKSKKLLLRYGENPNQEAHLVSYSKKSIFDYQISGKKISYNNIIDLDSGIRCLNEFNEPTSIIIKHTNPCGVASAKNINKLHHMTLKSCGLSRQKILYLKILSNMCICKPTLFTDLKHLSNNDIICELTKLKGIGEWTAQMYLIFQLNRQDVVPMLDIGFINSFKKIYKINDIKSKKSEQILQSWKPYSTVAVWYIWRVIDPDVVQY